MQLFHKRHLLLLSGFLGNFFEHYDTALFGFLAVFLAPLIFPNHDPITGLILTYAIIPLGMLLRPFGALFFGYVGDRYGRKQALSTSLIGMSVVSFLLAFCPLYVDVGLISPLLFGLGRCLQNFLAAGETTGGAVYLLENSPKEQHDFLSSVFNASTIGGILFASAGVSFIAYFDSVEYGWRVLYLLGSITGLFGIIIRAKLPETFTEKTLANFSIVEKVKSAWQHRFALTHIIFCAGLSYASYSFLLVLLNAFLPLISSITKEEVMALNTILLVIDFIALPLFGWIAFVYSRQRMMFMAASCIAMFTIPLCFLLENADISTIIYVRVLFVLLGVAFSAPFHAWALRLVPPDQRYFIISIGYALGSQLLGGPTVSLSLWLFRETEWIGSIGILLALLASINCALLLIEQYYYRARERNAAKNV